MILGDRSIAESDVFVDFVLPLWQDARAVRAVLLPLAVLIAVCAPAALAQTGGGGMGGPPPDDPCPTTYPGDATDKSRIARWLARGAIVRGLPAELPVMVAIAETGVGNIPSPDKRYLGYFQMDKHIWNTGDYKGYPKNPELQLLWFTDYAVEVRQRAIAEGDLTFGTDDALWGEWVGVVENPGNPAVEHYQSRLEEARALIAGDCTPAGFAPDRTPPTLKVAAVKRQSGSISIRVRCAGESCMAGATAYDEDRKRRGKARPMRTTPGKATILSVAPRASRTLRIETTAVDEAGNARTIARRVDFTR